MRFTAVVLAASLAPSISGAQTIPEELVRKAAAFVEREGSQEILVLRSKPFSKLLPRVQKMALSRGYRDGDTVWLTSSILDTVVPLADATTKPRMQIVGAGLAVVGVRGPVYDIYLTARFDQLKEEARKESLAKGYTEQMDVGFRWDPQVSRLEIVTPERLKNGATIRPN